jgi:hypothetical protein
MTAIDVAMMLREERACPSNHGPPLLYKLLGVIHYMSILVILLDQIVTQALKDYSMSLVGGTTE